MRRPPGRAARGLVVLLVLGLAVGMVLYLKGRPAPLPPPHPAPEDGRGRVRVGISGRPACLPVRALARLLLAESITLEVKPIEDADWRWQLLAAGELDLVLTTLDDFALAVPRHDPGVLIFPSAYSQGSDALVAAPSLESAEGLDGRRVAYVPGGAGPYLITSCLSGFPAVHPQLVEARDLAQARAWLEGGEVTAAALWQPAVEALVGQGYRLLWDSRRDVITDVWVASRRILKGDRAPELQAVAQEWFTLVRKLEEQPGLVIGAIAGESGLSPREVEQSLQGLLLLDLEQARRTDAAELSATLKDRLTLWSLRDAPNARRVDYSAVVDLSLLERFSLPPRTPLPAPETPPWAPAPLPGETPAGPSEAPRVPETSGGHEAAASPEASPERETEAPDAAEPPPRVRVSPLPSADRVPRPPEGGGLRLEVPSPP